MFVFDERFLAISAIVCFGWQLMFYIIAAGFKFDKVTDLAYGTNFLAVAIITLIINGSFFARQIVISVMVAVWGFRIALFLFVRIVLIGKDPRFDGTRENPIKFAIWFFLQCVTTWTISLPVCFLNGDNINVPLKANDYVGWVLWGIGFLSETISDQQKFSFRNKKENRDKWCDVGLWKLSRHPNYFGEICCWWGIWISCASTFRSWDWFSILSPVYITIILMFGSGVPTTEKSSDQKFWNNEEYRKYKERTPVLIPFIPGIFTGVGKLLCCCEFPIFSYPPDKTPLSSSVNKKQIHNDV